MPHWSATRFTLFEQCRQAFKARYVDEEPFQMTEAVAFGQAVHMGLEAHYHGDDGERAFRAAWKQFGLELGRVDASLTRTGLQLLEQVYALDLSGVPERGFSLDTNEELGAPIVGAVDLWGDDVVYDFKTTRGAWSQERAQKEAWQPLLYTRAYFDETDRWPAFEYIVLDRVQGTLSRFERQWTTDEWVVQHDALCARMAAIAQAVRAGDFDCRGSHGYCPECGDRFSHDHACMPLERARL
jgi:PD-(D/E)XK nuclease superfamily